MSRPSVREISEFLADLAAHRTSPDGSYVGLMARKADLLERIAADMPGDSEAAEAAANARARADQLKATN